MERMVRTSAKALVIRDGRMLAVKLKDKDGVFYIMPGGGQTAGELLPAAVEREVAEETGIAVKVNDAAFIIEGEKGEDFHRVDIVFRCDYLGTAEAEEHTDYNQIGFEWLDIATLNRAPLYPSKLRRPIMNLYAGKETAVYLGNENEGDPEVTDGRIREVCEAIGADAFIETMDEVLEIQHQGKERRRAAEAELATIENELRQKILEIRS